MSPKSLIAVAALAAVASLQSVAACGTNEVTARTWFVAEGRTFGYVPDASGLVGGGDGYSRVVVHGDYSASSIEELVESLRMAGPGDTVYVPGKVVLDFTGRVLADGFILRVPGGVTLASNRGVGGSVGALVKSDALATYPLVFAEGPGVRLTGLRIQGPDSSRRLEHWEESFSSKGKEERNGLTPREHYYSLPVATGVYADFDGLEIDNCELSGWSHAAVLLATGRGHHIHHNYIHGNQRQGLGYGISHGTAFSVIEHNLFCRNRHSIAGSGRPPSGYVARYNVELGQSLSHNFDMHGGRDRGDGTRTAGSRIEIYNNTFLGDGRAIGIRGRPDEYARIYGNWFVHHCAPGPAVFGWWSRADTVELGDNLYGARAPIVR